MYLYQSPDGKGITAKQWEKHRNDPEWTVKEYRNSKIWVRVHWVGRYPKSLPSEYRNPFGIQVKNRLIMRESEWTDEDVVSDKGWIEDSTASQGFRTKSAALSAYEDLLITYTGSYIDDEEGELVEEDNELEVLPAGNSLLRDEAAIEAAKEKGVDLGGWS